jgi:hypothetical protein
MTATTQFDNEIKFDSNWLLPPDESHKYKLEVHGDPQDFPKTLKE